jgi:uridine kinase
LPEINTLPNKLAMTKRSQLSEELARRIIQINKPHALSVTIDGPDAAGKTTLARELVGPLQSYGRRVIRASIDGFHNPAHIRHRRGHLSPEGYYHDSFNYQALIESLLTSLGPGGSCRYFPVVFDYRTDSNVQTPIQIAETNDVLLFDGVFLLRPELLEYWDYAIFVDAGFEVTLARAERRDAILFGSVEEVRGRYEQRYISGQKLYYNECRPKERANIVVDNNDLHNPVML